MQRAHNLPMKTWHLLEVPKTATPVILLDSTLHQFLYFNRNKNVHHSNFSNRYSAALIEKGLISAHGIWTQEGIDIMDKYELNVDQRLLVKPSNAQTDLL